MTTLTDWRQNAACRNTSPDLFFPGTSDKSTAGQAKAVCRTCPADTRTACLQEALSNETGHKDTHGIWGGLTPRERRAYARQHGGTVTAVPAIRYDPAVPDHLADVIDIRSRIAS